jgi:CMP-N,N'-diacetyllegionaminic acid synthase
LDAIKDIVPHDNICVSTDDEEIVKIVKQYGVPVPFTRPAELSKDTSSTQEVIDHALSFYNQKNKYFKGLVLLQPTSPFRKSNHIMEALSLFSDEVDMVVSVKITTSNPYYVLYEENEKGYLEISKKGNYTRRQDCPIVYERNGAIYIYNLSSPFTNMNRQRKYLMDETSSVDIDNTFDWLLAEFILTRNL